MAGSADRGLRQIRDDLRKGDACPVTSTVIDVPFIWKWTILAALGGLGTSDIPSSVSDLFLSWRDSDIFWVGVPTSPWEGRLFLPRYA